MHLLHQTIFLMTLAAGVAACRTPRNDSKPKEFQSLGDPEGISTLPAGVVRLPAADAAGISYQVHEIRQDIKEPNATVPTKDLDFEFKGLGQRQCEQLKDLYTVRLGEDAYRSGVKCQDGDVYRLEDFLPPIVGALKGKTFQQATAAQGVSVIGTLESNCWILAYEFSRLNNQEFTAFLVPASNMDEIFASYGQVVGTFTYKEGHTAADLERHLSQAVLGDTVFIHRRQYSDWTESVIPALWHAIVKIDGDIYLEKANPGLRHPYVFTTLENIRQQYKANTYGHDYTIVRLGGKLPSALENPALQYYDAFSTLRRTVFFPFPLVQDPNTGRYTLAEEAFDPNNVGDLNRIGRPDDLARGGDGSL